MDSTRSPFRFLTSAADEPGLALRKQQRLDGASTVHGAVAFSHLIESERQVEHLPRIDFAAPHQVDQLGQVLPHWGGAAVEVHVLEEQVLAVQFASVRDSYIATYPPGRAARMACIIDSWVPTHSSTESHRSRWSGP